MESNIPEQTEQIKTQQRQIIEFFTVATEFCRLTETSEQHKADTYKETMLRLLTLLYLKGSLLPKITPEDESGNERFVNEEQWEAVYSALKTLFGDDDIFDKQATLGEAEPGHENSLIKGSMAEHFTDIWQDIKDFVLLYRKTGVHSKENAVWSCYILFRENWGIKTTELINALHNKVFMKIEDNDNIL